MASKTGKILAGLAAIAALGGIAYAATSGDGDDDVGNAGMVLSGDCKTLAVEDPLAFVDAWVKFTLDGGPTDLVDGSAAGMEAYMTAFLGHVFKDCFPPTPGDDFTWITLVPHEEHWTWDEIIGQLMLGIHGGPGLEGATPSGDEVAEAGADVSESPTEDPYTGIVADPDWDPDDLPPVPTPDPPTPEGEGEPDGGWQVWDLTPDNLVKAVTADNMAEGGISRAMEPANTQSPQESAVFLVYDPNFPGWPRMEQDLIRLANENPDVLFITASTVDTIKHLGLPEHPGMAWAVNAADKSGEFKYSEDAVSALWEEGPPSEQDWNALLGHANSPLGMSMSFG